MMVTSLWRCHTQLPIVTYTLMPFLSDLSQMHGINTVMIVSIHWYTLLTTKHTYQITGQHTEQLMRAGSRPSLISHKQSPPMSPNRFQTVTNSAKVSMMSNQKGSLVTQAKPQLYCRSCSTKWVTLSSSSKNSTTSNQTNQPRTSKECGWSTEIYSTAFGISSL